MPTQQGVAKEFTSQCAELADIKGKPGRLVTAVPPDVRRWLASRKLASIATALPPDVRQWLASPETRFYRHGCAA